MNKEKTILVVDDEANVRESLNEVFKDDYAVVMAGNGEEALEKMKTETPSIVLLDIMFPGMDGLETLRKIKENYDGLPVIIVSALGDKRTVEKAMSLGVVDYLVKPFDVIKIKKVVSMIFDRSKFEP